MEKPLDPSASASNNLGNISQNKEAITTQENKTSHPVSKVLRGSMFGGLERKIKGLFGNNKAKKTTKSDFTKYAITPSLPDLPGDRPHTGPLNPELFGIKKPIDPGFSKDVAKSLDEDGTAGESAASGEAPTRNGPLTGWTITPNGFSGPNPVTEISTQATHVEHVEGVKSELYVSGSHQPGMLTNVFGFKEHVPYHPTAINNTQDNEKGLFKRLFGIGSVKHGRTPLPTIKAEPTLPDTVDTFKDIPNTATKIDPDFVDTLITYGQPSGGTPGFEDTLNTGELNNMSITHAQVPITPTDLNKTEPIFDSVNEQNGENVERSPDSVRKVKKLQEILERKNEGLLLRGCRHFASRIKTEIAIAKKDSEDILKNTWKGSKEISLAYKDLPFKQKALLSTGLIALGIASGTAAVPLVISGTMRAMGFVGIYASYIKSVEQKREEGSGTPINWKDRGSAALLAGLVTLTLPEVFRVAGEALSPIISQTLNPIAEKVVELVNPTIDHIKEIIHSYHHPAPIIKGYTPDPDTIFRGENSKLSLTPLQQISPTGAEAPATSSAVPSSSVAETVGNNYGLPEAFPEGSRGVENNVKLNPDSVTTKIAEALPASSPSVAAAASIPATAAPTVGTGAAFTPSDVTMGHPTIPSLINEFVITKGSTLLSVISDTKFFPELAGLTDAQRTNAVANIINEIKNHPEKLAKLGLPDNLWLTTGKSLDLSVIHKIIVNSTINGESIIAHAKNIIKS